MSSEEGAEPVRIPYDGEFEPGGIAGIDGDGLKAGQRVILTPPEGVASLPGEPSEWPGIAEEVRVVRGRLWAGVRMADRDITVSYADLCTVLCYARHFDVDEDPAMIRVTALAERYRIAWHP
jgi:hypothetical protein